MKHGSTKHLPECADDIYCTQKVAQCANVDDLETYDSVAAQIVAEHLGLA